MKLEHRGHTAELECNSAVLRNAMQSSLGGEVQLIIQPLDFTKQDGRNNLTFKSTAATCTRSALTSD